MQAVAGVPSPKATKICTAIDERCEIQFLYRGQTVALLQPHIIFSNVAGVALVEGFIPRNGFEQFELGEIRDVVLKRGTKFEPHPSFNPADPAYHQIFCALK